MLASFSEFKFFQSFRVPVNKSDNLRFLLERDNDFGKEDYVDDAKLLDISVTGMGFSTVERISVGTEITISLQFKKMHLDLTGRIVRAFSDTLESDELIYGVELDEEKKIYRFLETFVMSFSTDRLKECLIDSALKERYSNTTDGFEMFSLMLSLFKDITHFGDKEGFLDNMLSEVVRVMNAQRASVFLINPETNELEAVSALGIDKEDLKFDYRLGIAGSVFTTGVALNIDTVSDRTRFNNFFDRKYSFETKSIICHPIHNREDKIIGVVQVINKRNEYRFTVEDEKTMKVLSLMFSSVFHKYNPMSESSQIRRFSTPFDRKLALIGKTAHMGSLRSTILKLKDLDTPTLIHGEAGVGKRLYAEILHAEGQRGLKTLEEIDCNTKNIDTLSRELWGSDEESKLVKCQGGTVILREICSLSMVYQEKLYEVLTEGGVDNGIVSIDARVIATTSKDLGQMTDEGTFYRPLHEYLQAAYVYMEPLRRRMDDFEMLLDYFLKLECKEQGLLIKSFAPRMVDKMKTYDWPSNIKELRMMVHRTVLYNPKTHIISDVELEMSAAPLVDSGVKQRMFGDLPFVGNFAINLKDRLAVIEREMILAEIKRCNGNKSKAAKEMGISREALRKKLLISREVLDVLENQYPTEKKKAA
jgi:two-component system response regulator HydG